MAQQLSRPWFKRVLALIDSNDRPKFIKCSCSSETVNTKTT